MKNKNRCIASCTDKPTRFVTIKHERVWLCPEHFTAFNAGQLKVVQVQNQSSVWEPGSNDFDRYQFEHRVRPSTPESRLAYSDLERMKVQRGPVPRHKQWIPSFANDDKALRLVVAQRIWRYAYLNKRRVPDEFVNELDPLLKISAEGTKKYLGMDSKTLFTLEQQFRHKQAVEQAGSYASLLLNVAYRAWRLRWHSTTIAETYGITPVLVRQILSKLRGSARQLGLVDEVTHHTKGLKRAYKPRPAMSVLKPKSSRYLRLKVNATGTVMELRGGTVGA